MMLRLVTTDFSSPQDLSAMIQYSVRWAVPFIFLVIATSALFRLFPGRSTRWLLRNRRYIGLCFAVAMAWQGAFIFIVSFSHSAHYYSEIYFLRDELEGSSGYLFLAAMTMTSFGIVRRRMTAEQWRFLHLSGVIFLWAYPFSVYWWNVFYYQTQHWFDWLFDARCRCTAVLGWRCRAVVSRSRAFRSFVAARIIDCLISASVVSRIGAVAPFLAI
jgi:hypothetical protein